MAESPSRVPGRIFISYRREETAYPAGWLYDRLANSFGGGQVFKDVDSIELGDDFVEVIATAVGSCDVLLALIGHEWLTITDEHGNRRLDKPDVFVRLEIEAALARNVRVIPILVDGARMPRADELPTSLAKLVRRQALDLSPSRFDFDTNRLLKVLARTLAEVRTGQEEAASMSAPLPTEPKITEGKTPAEPPGQSKPRPGEEIRPVVAAGLDAQKPPPASTKSGTKLRFPLSTRGRILAGVGVGVVIITLVVVAIVLASQPEPGVPPRPTSNSLIFRDDFSDQTQGWESSSDQGGLSHYNAGTYVVRAEPVQGGGAQTASPRKASRLYPVASSNLQIEVDGRPIRGSMQDAAYGVFCRGDDQAQGSAYTFVIGSDYVAIDKFTRGAFEELTSDPMPAVSPNGTGMKAECWSNEGQRSVNLVFYVNGQIVSHHTDSNDPLPTGTVGLVVQTGAEAKEAIEVEFDNFVVRQVKAEP
jgi:hypothetical protein